MTTVEFDPATHAIVPREPDDAMVMAAVKDMANSNTKSTIIKARYALLAAIAVAPDFVSIAAPERSEGYTPAAPAQAISGKKLYVKVCYTVACKTPINNTNEGAVHE